ncbi:MAG: alanine racemase [Clostridiales bacterium]|nr:alanine racemase [Clostridiales bacterium]
MEITRPTVMEVNLDAFNHNIEQIQKYIGNDVKIMPVIKANAYGTYINKRIDVLEQFDIVAVALVDEAVELRENGFTKEIFVLNQPYKDEIDKIIKYNITIGLSSNDFLNELGQKNCPVKIHLEIGTGMGRTGIKPSRVPEFLEKINHFKNIKVDGIYTHLSSADYDDSYTQKQLSGFNNAVNSAKEILGELKYVHCSASNGILNYPEHSYNLVRPGIILYGYESFAHAKEKIRLIPTCKLKSKITFLKEVEKDTSIGYSREYITKRKTKVATIPIGYADGLRRCLSNIGAVVINKQKAPIIGKICMDGFMADVTNIKNVSIGDDVYIWDNEIITLEEVANKANTINYEFLSTISNRVPRIFK